MRTRAIAAAEIVLIFPAALFMAALVVRSLGPLHFRFAPTAQQLIMWYAARMWTLWLLLLLLPFAVLFTGCTTILGMWDVKRPQPIRHLLAVIRADSTLLFVAATTITAAGILTIVVLHILAN